MHIFVDRSATVFDTPGPNRTDELPVSRLVSRTIAQRDLGEGRYDCSQALSVETFQRSGRKRVSVRMICRLLAMFRKYGQLEWTRKQKQLLMLDCIILVGGNTAVELLRCG